jgi:phosphoribosylformimino-5-aminoimidazole carboxamide ribotide isomerase
MLELIPAIDLLGDEAVRLRRGDYERVTLRRSDPEEIVRELAAAGAGRIHVVDLDGARAGGLRLERIARLVAAAGPVPVQASGGVRSIADAEALLAAGADRVVVGTAAWREPRALDELASALGERLVVAVDVREGRVAVGGWLADGGLAVEEAVDRCAAAGVARLLCTAIDRDGTLAGPDVSLAERVVARSGLPVIAAGGVRSEADLAALTAAGCEAAVVGTAILEGRLRIG